MVSPVLLYPTNLILDILSRSGMILSSLMAHSFIIAQEAYAAFLVWSLWLMFLRPSAKEFGFFPKHRNLKPLLFMIWLGHQLNRGMIPCFEVVPHLSVYLRHGVHKIEETWRNIALTNMIFLSYSKGVFSLVTCSSGQTTKAHPKTWEYLRNDSCCLCAPSFEIWDHLFFDCSFSWQVLCRFLSLQTIYQSAHVRAQGLAVAISWKGKSWLQYQEIDMVSWHINIRIFQSSERVLILFFFSVSFFFFLFRYGPL